MHEFVKTHEVTGLSVAEKLIGEKVVLVTLNLQGLGEYAAYLHTETDQDGNRVVCGVIELEGKKCECILVRGASPYGALLIMPLDDGSYL